jgi:hypothetical protein
MGNNLDMQAPHAAHNYLWIGKGGSDGQVEGSLSYPPGVI